MSVAAVVSAQLPYLRRYARALTGSQAHGDNFVRATLEAALADSSVHDALSKGRVELYSVFNKIWSSAHVDVDERVESGNLHEDAAQQRLAKMTPANRQALLLTTLEGFSTEDAAKVMGLETGEVEALVTQAVEEIDRESATTVLIIEDEPLISMHLEDLVTSLGHKIFGTAATRGQAREAVAERTPGLVLADIQLADGSSGIDAVADILKLGDVPVIFITAFPEKLLTGQRDEPTYLITKPFHEATVRAAISQALFFGSGRPLP